jgi:hypothetical protein
MLDRDGHPINGVSIDWIVILVLVACLVSMETRTGATLGDRSRRIGVADVAASAEPSVPFRKIITRYLATLIGFLPMLPVALAYFGPYGPDLDEIAASNVFTWLRITGVVAFGWAVFLSVKTIRKRDPLYDRIAGTAVVRV